MRYITANYKEVKKQNTQSPITILYKKTSFQGAIKLL